MSFFNSEMVQKDMDVIAEIQKKIVKEIPSFFGMNAEEKLTHINLLDDLLERQEVLYTRVTLSDDPDALEMKKQMLKSSELLGFGSNPDISMVFKSMRHTIDGLKKTINQSN